jgi:coiled-coil domain-containing protein 55
MNISLSGAGKKKNHSSLGFGLNNRSDKKSRGSSKNVFGDDEEDDLDQHDTTGRQAVNQQIAKEQAALRERAQAALTATEDPSLYDYDGAYDSFKPDMEKEKLTEVNKERKSKYIGDLLKAAKVREQERDSIYERRIAREQAEEDAQEEFAGKEKFITKAYKRKLEEREQWEQEEREKQREEEENDVTKKSAGVAIAGFYGNFSKNVSVGGQGEKGEAEEKEPPKENDLMGSFDGFDPRQGFMSDFEQSKVNEEGGVEGDPIGASATKDKASSSSRPIMTMREIREKKVREARIRYLKRKQAAVMNQ